MISAGHGMERREPAIPVDAKLRPRRCRSRRLSSVEDARSEARPARCCRDNPTPRASDGLRRTLLPHRARRRHFCVRASPVVRPARRSSCDESASGSRRAGAVRGHCRLAAHSGRGRSAAVRRVRGWRWAQPPAAQKPFTYGFIADHERFFSSPASPAECRHADADQLHR